MLVVQQKDEAFRSQGIGTLQLQNIQEGTQTKLKTNNMLVWAEVRPYQQPDNIDISIYYKRLGFHLTNPTKHDIQYIVPASVLSIINDTDSYSYIMRCS